MAYAIYCCMHAADLSELHLMIRPKMMLEDFAEWIENTVSNVFNMVSIVICVLFFILN